MRKRYCTCYLLVPDRWEGHDFNGNFMKGESEKDLRTTMMTDIKQQMPGKLVG